MKKIQSISILLTLMVLSFANCKDDKKDETNRRNLLLGAAAIASQQQQGVGTVETPTFTPAAGHLTTGGDITIGTKTEGATIHYSTDGADPTTSSTTYTKPVESIWLLVGKTVKAIAVKAGLNNSAILTGIFTLEPLKTGQTQCWESLSNTSTACSNVPGHDGNLQSGTTRGYTGPTAHSTYTTDYTTKDNATGLVWKTCSEGQTGADCSGGAVSTATWANAGTACTDLNSANSGNGYAGIKTWRLPSREELSTIQEYNTANRAINNTAFPNPGIGNFWTSTERAGVSTDAWYMNFANSVVLTNAKTTTYNVRCVSGQARETAQSFTDNGDGTIKDNRTGLIWQKCGRDQTGSDCTGDAMQDNYSESLSYCNNLSLAGKKWRVPNINELNSIVDLTKSTAPRINATYFPNTRVANYWTSTASVTGPTDNYFVSFDTGANNGVAKTDFGTTTVRCVASP